MYIGVYTHMNIYVKYKALCKYKGAEGNYLLPYYYYSIYIMIITPLYLTLYTASLILVAPPAALPLSATRLNLHSHQRMFDI